MKYRFLILVVVMIILITGCKNKQEDKILVCNFSNTTITLTIRNGKIEKYIDDIQGELSREKIEQLNDEYLKNITDNKEAYIKMREAIASNGGDCKN